MPPSQLARAFIRFKSQGGGGVGAVGDVHQGRTVSLFPHPLLPHVHDVNALLIRPKMRTGFSLN